MSKKLLFAAIASILATGAYATSATVTSKDYVDNTFQTKIPAKSTKLNPSDQSFAPSVVTNGATAGNIGQMGIVTLGYLQDTGDYDYSMYYDSETMTQMDSMIPSYGIVDANNRDMRRYVDNWLGGRQSIVPISGYKSSGYSFDDETGTMIWSSVNPITEGNGISDNDWLNSDVKGTGLVTKTSMFGGLGERKIIEESDVPNYQASNLTANQKAIQKISIPTMGAVMTAISNNTPTLPTGTANTVVMYNNSGAIGGSRGIYDGSTTYNSTNDVSKLATAGVVETKQAKKTCAGWPDGVEHTDANCWLWNMPD